MRERHIHAAMDCIRNGNVRWLFQQAYKAMTIPLSQGLRRPLSGPIEGLITPTYRCNSDCLMCDLKHRGAKETELSLKEWFRVIDDLTALGVSGIGISGGEPLLSEHTVPIVRYVTGKRLPSHISSNGFLLSEEKAEQLIDAGLGSIAVSIDSGDPKTNDFLRGVEGAFDLAVRGIQAAERARKRMKGTDLRLTVAAVLSKQSLDTVFDLIRLARDLGADTVSFLPVMTSGIVFNREDRVEDLTFNREDIARAHAVIDDLITYKRREGIIDNSVGFLKAMKSYFLGRPFPATCFAGYTICVVGADGKIFPCFDFLEQDRSVGNVRDVDLKEFWWSEDYGKMRRVTARCRDCYLTCHQEFNLLYRFTGGIFSG
ncbi:MAG: radical SAM protein [Deltaproteobacteria bacterium]|nr:radical SAM protein [Deltaproteobacteria bacterium]